MSESKQRAAEVVRRLTRLYPEARCTLEYDQPWQLLIAAILASQSTDARVNQVTPVLFSRFPSLHALSEASFEAVAAVIRSLGLHRHKTKAILGSSRMLLEDHDGNVPQTYEGLMALPGVGRKIASLILGELYGKPAIVVDTHCGRLSRRLGFSAKKDPLGVEKDLRNVLMTEDWIAYGHLMVHHGRQVCLSKQPACDRCRLLDLCPTGRKGEEAGL